MRARIGGHNHTRIVHAHGAGVTACAARTAHAEGQSGALFRQRAAHAEAARAAAATYALRQDAVGQCPTREDVAKVVYGNVARDPAAGALAANAEIHRGAV